MPRINLLRKAVRGLQQRAFTLIELLVVIAIIAILDHGPDYNLPASQDFVSRSTTVKSFFCPSDTGPIVNELPTREWARSPGNYRGCVGAGNYFGDQMPADRMQPPGWPRTGDG